MKKITIFLLLATALFMSCQPAKKGMEVKEIELVPLTNQLIKDYKITGKILSGLQYYSGDSVVLLEDISYKEANASPEGKLILKDAQTTNAIVVGLNRPGVCIFLETDKRKNFVLRVVYGKDNNKFLVYGPGNDADGTYKIYLLERNSEGEAKVLYGKQKMILSNGDGSPLLINIKELEGKGKEYHEPGRILKKSPRA